MKVGKSLIFAVLITAVIFASSIAFPVVCNESSTKITHDIVTYEFINANVTPLKTSDKTYFYNITSKTNACIIIHIDYNAWEIKPVWINETALKLYLGIWIKNSLYRLQEVIINHPKIISVNSNIIKLGKGSGTLIITIVRTKEAIERAKFITSLILLFVLILLFGIPGAAVWAALESGGSREF